LLKSRVLITISNRASISSSLGLGKSKSTVVCRCRCGKWRWLWEEWDSVWKVDREERLSERVVEEDEGRKVAEEEASDGGEDGMAVAGIGGIELIES